MLAAMERLEPLFEEAEVLDTGAGSGIVGLTSLAAPGFKARKVMATDLRSKVGETIRANARFFGVRDHLEFSAGSLLEPVRGRRFNVALHNPAGYEQAVDYLKGIGAVLESDGMALLLWKTVSEGNLRTVAKEHDLLLEPRLRSPDHSWQVYAITRTQARMKQVLALAKRGGEPGTEAPGPAAGLEGSEEVTESPAATAAAGLEQRADAVTRRDFLGTAGAAAASALLAGNTPAVDRPSTEVWTFGEVVASIQEALARRSSEVARQIPPGVEVMPLSDTSGGRDLSDRVPAGYEGQGLFAVSTAVLGRRFQRRWWSARSTFLITCARARS